LFEDPVSCRCRQAKRAAEQLQPHAEMEKRADEMLRVQEDMQKRSEALIVAQEELIKKQQDDAARFGGILETWESQQKQYQKYLDSLLK
jgi:two-component sensor histidine kinase